MKTEPAGKSLINRRLKCFNLLLCADPFDQACFDLPSYSDSGGVREPFAATQIAPTLYAVEK